MTDVYQLDSQGLAKLVAQVAASLRSDADLRQIQGNNAQQAKAYDQPGVVAGSPAVTAAVIYAIAEAQGQVSYYSMVLTFDTNSGSGRYLMDGPTPTPAGFGVGIPAGGCVLTIIGANNIKNFKMVAETGQTLTFARYLFL